MMSVVLFTIIGSIILYFVLMNMLKKHGKDKSVRDDYNPRKKEFGDSRQEKFKMDNYFPFMH